MVKGKVYHATYGDGVIKEVDEAAGKIVIDFGKRTFTFPYPDAFREHLTAENEALQKELLNEKRE